MVHCRCGRGIPNRAPYGGTFSAAGEILRGLPRKGTVGEELPVSLAILLILLLLYFTGNLNLSL